MSEYYTPEIDEFCINFPFEYRSDRYLQILDNTKGQWEAEEFSAASGQDGECERDDIEKLISENNLRVKHLDQEDIESFGFTKDNVTLLSLYTDKDDVTRHFEMVRSNESGEIEIHHCSESQKTVIKKRELKNSDDLILFFGTIRNKSELSRILKQVGVL